MGRAGYSFGWAAKQALIKILKELSNEAIVVIITHNSDLLNACETIYHL